jgi:hypothetical protein
LVSSGRSFTKDACLFFREILWPMSLLLRSTDLLLPFSALLIFARLHARPHELLPAEPSSHFPRWIFTLPRDRCFSAG